MFVDFVKYLQEKLDAIASGVYVVSSERNVDADYTKNQVVASALSGNVFEDSATIPYQIDIVTCDIDGVMGDFTMLAMQNNNVTFTAIVQQGEGQFQSYTITPFFNTPVVMEKDVAMGSDKYARIVVFASVSAMFNVSNVKSLKIDSEEVKFLNATLAYSAELVSNRVSGQELNASKKKASSTSLSFQMVNKASALTNKLLSIASGSLKGNTSFSVEIEMDNGLKLSFPMVVSSYALSVARQMLPSINVGMFVYDSRGDQNAAS